tara:strand:- start:50339 stop:51346 length:1008 start_codon:yes stop_codon:yes gene_type:complete
MSTIEKAVNKLGRENASGPAQDNGPGKTSDTLEKVVASNESTVSSTPAAAQNVIDGQPQRPSTIEQSASATPSQNKSIKLPLAQLSEKGMLTPLTPRSRIAEEFRGIKRPLLRNIDGNTAGSLKNANLIMVTSALQGDGKTFTAINLAISIAMEQDKTVLFVDADVAKASAGTRLGIPPDSLGLIDVLENDSLDLGDVIVQTDIPNLRIVPAGNVHERATELLASNSMNQLMLEMSSRYPDRVIVFDSPPLLLTTEASVLASFMGQIAFVVSTDETPQEAVSEALEHIGADKAIGMILNKAHTRRNKLLGFGYAYGYGYGSGYGHDERPLPAKGA